MEEKEQLNNLLGEILEVRQLAPVLKQMTASDLQRRRELYEVSKNMNQAKYEELIAEGFSGGDSEVDKLVKEIEQFDKLQQELDIIENVVKEMPAYELERKIEVYEKRKELLEARKEELIAEGFEKGDYQFDDIQTELFSVKELLDTSKKLKQLLPNDMRIVAFKEEDKNKDNKDKEDKNKDNKDKEDKDKEDKDKEDKDKEDKDKEDKDKDNKDKEDKNKDNKDKEDKNKDNKDKEDKNKDNKDKEDKNKDNKDKEDKDKDNKDKEDKDKEDKDKEDKDKDNKDKEDKDKDNKDKEDKNKDNKDKKTEPNFKIVIGRNGKIVFGNDKKEIKVPKIDIKEGTNLDVTDVEKILKKYGIENIEKGQLQELFETNAIDPIVINAIRRSSMEKEEKESAIKDYWTSIKNPSNPKVKIVYKQSDLSKTSILNRIFKRTEVNSEEKYKILCRAQMGERYGFAKMTGEYKPGWKSNFIANITGERIQKLPSVDKLHEVANVYNKLREQGQTEIARSTDASRKQFKLSLQQAKELKSLHEIEVQKDMDSLHEVANVYNELRDKGQTSNIKDKEERKKIHTEKGLSNMQMNELRSLQIKQERQENRHSGEER